MASTGAQTKGLYTALFSPQRTCTQWQAGSIEQLQHQLLSQPELSFLADALESLNGLSGALGTAFDYPDAERQLQWLHEFAARADGDGNHSRHSTQNLCNTQLAPLTVVSQTIDLLQKYGFPSENDSLPQFESCQGFCIGFLSAASLASSRNWEEYRTNISNAIRLAACIGVIVDAEDSKNGSNNGMSALSVRWKTPTDRTYLEMCLDTFNEAYISCVTDEKSLTITLPSSQISSFRSRLEEAGITSLAIGLNGSYHNSRHSRAAGKLINLCATRRDLQLPDASRLHLHLRSTSDGSAITTGKLHDWAIQLILCKRAHWSQTVKQAVSNTPKNETPKLVAIGEESCIPRSITGNKPRTRDRDGPARVSKAPQEEIAVVGIACRFPEADNLHEFWQLLQGGGSAIGTMPSQRFKQEMIDRDPKPNCFWGNFLRRPDAFDHRFFDISGREAKSMDPQQRLVLQVAYEALESSGYYGTPASQRTADVGCYLGVGAVDYEDNIASEAANAFSATGSLRAFISGRISHFFGWSGPSLTLDTACSSSAVAIHTACKALLGGECSMALAGGVNVITSPNLHQNLAGASFLNASGASKAFDADAGGYCRGEGSGVLVLKPLSKALAAGDEVLGVISGSAVNQGGNHSSITVPDSEAQSSLYRRVLSSGGINPTDVTYVEAHGTGTQVGDPIEYESIRRALTGPNRTDTLYVGSVKDNIGHAEAASGVAGVIKTLMMMHFGTIPQQANFKSLNPKIKSLPMDRITIPTASEPWVNELKAALVNNYGAAGSNAAILLRNHKPSAAKSIPQKPSTASYPVLLSAKTANSLELYKRALQSFLAGTTEDIGDVAWSVNRRQNAAFEHRAAFVVSPSSTGEILSCTPIKVQSKPVILAFGGQTGRRCVASRSLYEQSSIFRGHLDTCNMICETLGLPAIIPRLFEGDEVDDLVLLHCMLLALQVASARTWIDSGVEVESLVGHSFGQIAALCVAESISLLDAFKFVSGRASLIGQHWSEDAGAMLSVEGSQFELEEALAQFHSTGNHKVEIACYNGASSFVLAGETDSIEASEKALSASFKTKRLQNSHAYHSYMANGIMDPLRNLAESIKIQAPRIKVETCSAGQSWTQFTSEALCQHTREPVYFAEAIRRIASRSPSAIWLEAGSASPVIPMIRRILRDDGRPDAFVATDLGQDTAMANLAAATCQLWTGGSSARYWLFNHTETSDFKNVYVPPYQFEQTSHWIDLKPRTMVTSQARSSAPLVGEVALVSLIPHKSSSTSKTFAVNTRHPAFQLASKGHAVTSKPLCPASMYIELVSRCLMEGDIEGTQVPYVEGLTMSAPLGLSSTKHVYLRLDKTTDASWKFSMVSGSEQELENDDGIVEHANGTIALLAHDDEMANMRLKILQKFAKASRADRILNDGDSTGISGKLVYKIFSDVVEYANYYRGVKSLSALDNEAIGTVLPPTEPLYDLENSICDPVALDNFLQVAGIHVNCLSPRKSGEVFMCTSVNETVLSPAFMADRSASREWVVYTQYESVSEGMKSNDILVCDKKTGNLVVAVLGATFRSVPFKSLARTLGRIEGHPKLTIPNLNPLPAEFDSQDSGYQTRAASPSTSEIRKDFALNGASPPLPSQEPPRAESSGSANILRILREMLSEIIEIPVEEIEPTSTFDDLGVDSLLVTEVITEIKKRCKVTLTQAELFACPNLAFLADRIHPGVATTETGPGIQTTSSKLLPQPVLDSLPESTQAGGGLEAVGELALASNTVFSDTSDLYDRYAKKTGFTGFCADVYPSQAELVVQYVVEAFKALGCDMSNMSAGESLVPIQHDPKHLKVVRQLHKILEDAKLIEPTRRGGYRRTSTPVSSTSSAILHSEMLTKFPKHASETELLWTTAHKLAQCLTGDEDPIALLFGDASARALIGDVYASAPMFKTGTLVLGDYLLSVLKSLDLKREVRILEIGAGTGGTTQHIVNTLAGLGARYKFSYTFTDLSSSLVMAAKKKFSKYGFMKYSTMDIEKDPEDKHLGSYDIVISTNCIHATRDLTHTTSNIRKLLRPDGILCLLELTRNLFWFDLVFGLLEGWWLSSDGREHALASEWQWDKSLRSAGFPYVSWTDTPSSESDIMRMIVASPFDACGAGNEVQSLGTEASRRQTVTYKTIDGVDLLADIYLPQTVKQSGKRLPVALMIHGGGHVMLSRRDIRPEQTSMLLDRGFLPVSVDYRLCPEVPLSEGPMVDIVDALAWARSTLPHIKLSRLNVRADPEKLVAVGWSTGGHLAMTLAWSTIPRHIRPPDAILAFYCPVDYEDPFWSKPNVPKGSRTSMSASYELDEQIWEGISDRPLTAYNVAKSKRAVGGWLAPDDSRSRLALHMNYKGKTLPVLLNGLDKRTRKSPSAPTSEQIQSVSPLAQVVKGVYKTPTFIIHPRQDDLIPWEQAQRTHDALVSSGVEAHLIILEDVPHLFDVVEGYEKNKAAYGAVTQGYDFLRQHVA